jgi:hypothetical protein
MALSFDVAVAGMLPSLHRVLADELRAGLRSPCEYPLFGRLFLGVNECPVLLGNVSFTI